MSEIRSAQLYSVCYYGASRSSLPAGVNAGRLKKPRLRNGAFASNYCLLRSYCSQDKGWSILSSLFMPLILCLTVAASVGIGVLSAYLAVIGILHACGRPSQPRPAEV